VRSRPEVGTVVRPPISLFRLPRDEQDAQPFIAGPTDSVHSLRNVSTTLIHPGSEFKLC
jgi:hypothetical protein